MCLESTSQTLYNDRNPWSSLRGLDRHACAPYLNRDAVGGQPAGPTGAKMHVHFEDTLTARDCKRHILHRVAVPQNSGQVHIGLRFGPYREQGIANLLTLAVFDPAGCWICQESLRCRARGDQRSPAHPAVPRPAPPLARAVAAPAGLRMRWLSDRAAGHPVRACRTPSGIRFMYKLTAPVVHQYYRDSRRTLP